MDMAFILKPRERKKKFENGEYIFRVKQTKNQLQATAIRPETKYTKFKGTVKMDIFFLQDGVFARQYDYSGVWRDGSSVPRCNNAFRFEY